MGFEGIAEAAAEGKVAASTGAWHEEAWLKEQEALFEAEMATQSHQRREIIGTEWGAHSAQRTADLNAALAAIRNTEGRLLQVRSTAEQTPVYCSCVGY
jgi:hypothetical protein